VNYRVAFHPRAIRDLHELADYIVEHGSPARAAVFVGRIQDYCLGIGTFPERGTLREDLGPGVRLVGFRRRVSITFAVRGDVVHVLGIFYGGRNIDLGTIGDEDIED
jgi:toxin ParE1/3/4